MQTCTANALGGAGDFAEMFELRGEAVNDDPRPHAHHLDDGGDAIS